MWKKSLITLLAEKEVSEDKRMAAAKYSRVLRIIPLMFIVALFCPLTYGKIIHVNDDATGANNGTSWEDAYVYLQDALVPHFTNNATM